MSNEMSNEIPTPRTEQAFADNTNNSHIVCLAALEVLSRQLERELTEVTKQRDALAKVLTSAMSKQ
jgi:hypothetical protein